MSPCPYCSTLSNGFRLYGPNHPCFTVYDPKTTTDGDAVHEGDTRA
ncbi:hypothetical protein GUY44_07515 [Pimelobacter simplex]|uniref:Uncharacterized protein n=1 Tax=Nocardioides simplex TaxID=2045 RepID=A0A0C5XB55_NOCSI|nr:hypothetical protein [Pimelobacter simplex]AJR18029.1 hypothetical protein KR76_00017 [Pimelobacter simplex]MCG8150322.1 hypothetical protein [Pimelobacter simplex]GEB16688.1 hypothetical protein NSI01_50030 [Pimelobacter simplex]SFM89988.1 hypothetical protein SAMN05421671_4095 [Pimelobacter simplex]